MSIVKRLFDVFVSLVLLLLLVPFFLLVSIIILLTMGRPVFFIQERIGLNEKTIRLFKFRSMSNEKDEAGKLLSNAQRVTRFGAFIRKASIDELPSLLNVLKGDLSLVGPRPLLVEYLPCYKAEHRVRHNVRPGITGLAQVNGRNATIWQNRLDFDKQYVENLGFVLDLEILVLTVYKVFKRDGIEGNADLSITRLDKDSSYLGCNND